MHNSLYREKDSGKKKYACGLMSFLASSSAVTQTTPHQVTPPQTTPSQAMPPPWIQEQQKASGKELLQQLKQARLSEQASLTQAPCDKLEEEFSGVVKPVMESCTKDSISVSLPLMLLLMKLLLLILLLLCRLERDGYSLTRSLQRIVAWWQDI